MSGFEDFEDDVKASGEPYRRRGCGVGQLLKTLAEPDAKLVERVLNNHRLSSPAIAAALKRRVKDAAPSSYTINRHRRGTCRCSEE